MKKIAIATVAMLGTITFLASSKEHAEQHYKAIFIAEKANLNPGTLTAGIAAQPLTGNKANLAQADYGDN